VKATVEVTVEVDIERPPGVVWEVVADPARSPEWIEEFVESHAVTEGEPRVGSVVSYTIVPGPRTGTFELTGWDPPRRMAFEGPPLRSALGAGRPRGSFELSERDDRATHLVCTFRPELVGMAVLLKPYFRRWLRRQRAADLLKLKAIVEADDR
jgi:uncharacterized protein YndB with AHSA1/START domain